MLPPDRDGRFKMNEAFDPSVDGAFLSHRVFMLHEYAYCWSVVTQNDIVP